MKKIIYIALAIVAIASCTKKKIEPIELGTNDQAITFNSLVARKTRAISVPTSFLPVKDADENPTSFRVFAKSYTNEWNVGTTLWSAATNYFAVAGSLATYTDTGDDNGWVTSPKYYWPKQANTYLAFQAYFPSIISNGTAASTATGITLTDFEINTERDGQDDILYANRVINKKQNDDTKDDGHYYDIDLLFNHALTQVAFKAKYSGTTLETNEWIKIKSIKLVNVYTKANFNQNLNDDNSTPTNSPSWGSYGYKQEGDPLVDVKEYKNVVKDYSDVTDLTSLKNDTAIDTDFSTYFVIPQNFATDTKLVVTYETKLGAVDEEISEENTKDIILSSLTFKHTEDNSNAEAKFEIGKKYTFNIVINLDPIYFDPSVDAWVGVNVTGDDI